MILAPMILEEGRELNQQLDILMKQGFSRVEENGEIRKIQDLLDGEQQECKGCPYSILIDRIQVNQEDDDLTSRLADSVQTALYEGKGECILKIFDSENNSRVVSFSDRFEKDGIQFEAPTVHLFSFNNPIGACPVCEGFGKTIGIDEDLVVPNKSLSIYDEAIFIEVPSCIRHMRYHLFQKGPLHCFFWAYTCDTAPAQS